VSYRNIEGTAKQRAAVLELLDQWSRCAKCAISGYAKHRVQFRGHLPARIVVVGEAPGKTEDVVGVPFVGRAGKLLDAWLADVGCKLAILNLVACRPTSALGGENRQPTIQEQGTCFFWFRSLLQLAAPRAVILLGKSAREHEEYFRPYGALPVLRVPHPAYILRLGGVKPEQFEEVKTRIEAFAREHGGGA
jgi:DNA polymerase